MTKKISRNIILLGIVSFLTDISSEIIFDGEELKELFDYFEHIQTSIIFSYTAVEAFSNAAIPNNFVIEEVNNKGVKETWNKRNIERWYSTSEKLTKILPNTLAIESPVKSSFWKDFKKLEELRNDIIHLKTTNKNYELKNDFIQKFFQKNIFRLVEAGLKVIKFYGNNNKARFFIPIELGNKRIDIIQFDEFKKYFTISKVDG